MAETATIGGRRLRIGNPDKVMFDAAGVTKRQLVDYYRSVADVMLPHVKRRPLAMHRFPDGVDAGGFFHKQRPQYAPDWVGEVRVPREQGGAIEMVVCDDTATLAWLADQATITLHPWLSRVDDLDRPDRIIFDLDPPDDDFSVVRRAAQWLHEVLDELRLPSYVMTTGSRGLHVVVPIRVERPFDEVRDFARGVADLLAGRHADQLTTQVRKEQRGGRLFVDILRNAYGQHAVAPYAVRPLPEAPVAMPLRWEELDDTRTAQRWTVRDDLTTRLRDNPWHGMQRHARSLDSARRRLDRVS